MEIVEHLVMDDPVAIGGDLYVVENLVVSLVCVDGDLHISTNMELVVVDVDEDLLMKHYV